jgi:archaellum component FlaG (FlaF/FlaG flagellin family)
VAVVAATILTAAIIPSIAQVSQVYNQQAQRFKDKGDLQLTVIFAEGSAGQRTATVWVKNTGISSLQPSLINRSELFFGMTDNFSRFQYDGSGPSNWNYTILHENPDANANFNPGDTLQVNLNLNNPLSAGDYYVKFVTYLGTSSEYIFSI